MLQTGPLARGAENFNTNSSLLLQSSYDISSEIPEIEDFELSLTSNAMEGTIEIVDSFTSAKQSRKTSPAHEHCRAPTPDERKETSEPKWGWRKHCLKYYAQNTSNIRQHLDSVHGIIIDKAPDFGIRTTATETIEALYTKLNFFYGLATAKTTLLRRFLGAQLINRWSIKPY